MSKTKARPSQFMLDNMPKMPDFMKENAPTLKFDPNFSLGPPAKSIAYQTLLEVYFRNDISQIYADLLSRPDHYDAEQKDIIERLWRKEALRPEAQQQDIDEIVLRFFDRSQQRKQRETLVQKAQKKLSPPPEDALDDDPTLRRKLEEAKLTQANEEHETKLQPKYIKII
jgi:hypothetical protein